jgi:hypothetical protein
MIRPDGVLRRTVDKAVDEVVEIARKGGVSPFQIRLIDKVFRKYLFELERVQEHNMDPQEAEDAILEMMSNMFTELMLRRVQKGNKEDASDYYHSRMHELAVKTAEGINANWADVQNVEDSGQTSKPN